MLVPAGCGDRLARKGAQKGDLNLKRGKWICLKKKKRARRSLFENETKTAAAIEMHHWRKFETERLFFFCQKGGSGSPDGLNWRRAMEN